MASPSPHLLPPAQPKSALPSFSFAQQCEYLEDLPELIEAKNYSRYYQHLTDFNFLIAKIYHPDFGIYFLIKDYELAPSEALNSEEGQTLKLIQETLKLYAHILAIEPEQLATQLWGRLQSFALPDIKMLLQRAIEQQNQPWLRPLTTSFTPPGGNLSLIAACHSNWVNAVAVSPDGKKVISASLDYTAKVWDINTGKNLLTFTDHIDSVTAVALTPDGEKVISGSDDNTVNVWDINTGENLLTFTTSHSDCLRAIAVTSDGGKVISGSDDNTVNIWNINTGQHLLTFAGHSGPVTAIVLTPDGKKVISGSYDKTIQIWDIATGRHLLTLVGHSDWLKALAVTPDGKKIISGSYDATVKVWDIITGKNLLTFDGHSDWLRAVAVSPDGKKVISGSYDTTVQVWDIITGELITSFTGDSSIECCTFAPDGLTIIAGEKSGQLHFLRLEGFAG